DVLIVDRSMVASRGKLAVVVKDGEFKIVKFNRNETSGETEEQLLWGVITYVIHQI
ncbi:MAG TPA: peptidase S24, partial [Leeuwenhoekiella sp.]|nr:peptidase S24 [Leeuwenhoekiella sp.]